MASVLSKIRSVLYGSPVGSASSRSSTKPTSRDVPKRESTLVIPEVINSRKRTSDVALLDSFANSKESSSKAKTDSKTPLGQVTSDPIVSPSRGVSTMYPSLVMDESSIFDNPRTKLEDIQMSIEEVSLDRKSKKPRLNAENHRTIADIKSELQGLRRRIHETKSTYRSKDSRRVPMNETIVKKEPVVDRIINSQSHPLSDRRANVPQPFPMAMEVDRKPFIKPEEPPARHGARALFPAPSSNPPANEPQTIHPWKLESKPRITPPKQPVACSKDPSPSDAEDEDYGNPTIAVDLVNRIGINVPPPIDNEAMDDNGDYYGRGTDLFEGPRASGDEYVIFFSYFSP